MCSNYFKFLKYKRVMGDQYNNLRNLTFVVTSSPNFQNRHPTYFRFLTSRIKLQQIDRIKCPDTRSQRFSYFHHLGIRLLINRWRDLQDEHKLWKICTNR